MIGATLLLPLLEATAPDGPGLWADSTSLLKPEGHRCSGRGGLALDLWVTAMKSATYAAPGWWPALSGVGSLGSSAAQSSFWRSELKSGTYRLLHKTQHRFLLPLVLVAQVLEVCFHLAMMVHILADLCYLGGDNPLGPGVAVFPIPIQPPHEPMDDGQAGLPTLRVHLDQVPSNSLTEIVVQPVSTAHFHYGFPTVKPLSWYKNKLLSRNLKNAIFQLSKRCHTP